MNEEIIEVQERVKYTAGQVDKLIASLLGAEKMLDGGYARLGLLLSEVNEKQYWKELGQESFGQYVKTLSEKYNRGRTQLYAFFSTAKELRPYITEQQLTDMGIAKASEIKKSLKRTSVPPSDEIIAQAVNPKVTNKELKKLLFDSTNQTQEEKGTWVDIGGCYFNEEELLVYRSAREAALRTDPIVNTKDTPEWTQTKEFILRTCMEYLAAHGE